MLSDLTIQLYLVMYLMMFAAALVLRHRRPDQPRPFRVPGGNVGLWLVCGTGMLAALFSIAVGFFPPAQLRQTQLQPETFISFLVVGLLVSLFLPMVIYALRKRWSDVD